MNGGGEIQVENALPLGIWILLSRVQRGACTSTDRVHEDVYPPERVYRLLDCPVSQLPPGHVSRDDQRAPTAHFHGEARLRQRRRRPPYDRHRRAPPSNRRARTD